MCGISLTSLSDVHGNGITEMLSQEDWVALTQKAVTWYGTPGHCLLYSKSLPEWVAVFRDQRGGPIAACYGSVRRCLGLWRHVALAGPSTASLEMLGSLMARQGAWVLTMPYLGDDEGWSDLRWWKGALRDFESDWLIDLPSCLSDYLAALGRTTRRHVNTYARKLQERLDTQLVIAKGREIAPELVAELVELHRKRRVQEGRDSTLTHEVVERRIRLAQECGLFCGRRLEGRLIGGTLNYIHGQTACLSLVAHDPCYDHFHCGQVCLLDTIQQLINREGVNTYNLHVRHSPLKSRMGGKEHSLREAVILANPVVAIIWHVGQWARGRRIPWLN